MTRQRWTAGATAAAVLAFIVLGVPLTILLLIGPATSTCSSSTRDPTVPTTETATAAQMVRYLISQGLTPNAAAGIVGNLQQESSLNPTDPGGGLAQWNPSWYVQMADYATAHGLPPTSSAGQLMYLVWDLRGPYAWLLAGLNTAADPGTAAFMFETGYERCQGVTGFMVPVAPNAGCMDSNRRLYAAMALAAAGGTSTAVPVSYVIGAQCTGSSQFVAGSGLDPIPGFRPGRDDMGVDGCASPGMPIIAPAPSTLVDVLPDWYAGQPLLLFRFTPPLAGTLDSDQYWYVAEEDHTGHRVHRRHVPAAPGSRTLRPIGDLHRDRLGLANLKRPHPRRPDGRQRGSEPARRRAHHVGRDIQTRLSDPLGRSITMSGTEIPAWPTITANRAAGNRSSPVDARGVVVQPLHDAAPEPESCPEASRLIFTAHPNTQSVPREGPPAREMTTRSSETAPRR